MTDQHKVTTSSTTTSPPTPPSSTPPDDPKAAENKKVKEENEKKNDELIKQYLAEKGEGDSPEAKKKAEQLAKDQEKARILNQIYNEKYQPAVRKTPAQENAEKSQKEPELQHK